MDYILLSLKTPLIAVHSAFIITLWPERETFNGALCMYWCVLPTMCRITFCLRCAALSVPHFAYIYSWAVYIAILPYCRFGISVWLTLYLSNRSHVHWSYLITHHIWIFLSDSSIYIIFWCSKWPCTNATICCILKSILCRKTPPEIPESAAHSPAKFNKKYYK